VRWAIRAAFIAAVVAACSSGGDDGSADASGTDAGAADGSLGTNDDGAADASTASVAASPPTPDAATTSPPEVAAETEVAPTVATTLQAVSTVVLGGIVGGNSGAEGEGSTASESEVVREGDTCTGWDGPRDGGGWTENFTEGAEVRLLDAGTGEVMATGSLGRPVAENVSLSDDVEQWQCWFPFRFDVEQPPASQYAVSVGGGRALLLANDATRPGFVIGSIGTAAEAEDVDACSGVDPLPEEVSDWQSVGQYWDSGVSQICSAGLRVADGAIRRPCRPIGIASDRIISVVDAADPSIVYEDTSGVLVDPSDLEPGTAVVVNVASGIPCG
jgi:hypothetical protein